MLKDATPIKPAPPEAPNKEINELKRIGRVIKERVCTDILAMPFLIVWSFLICMLLETATDKKMGAFFKSTFEEGVALRTIICLLVLSMIVAGLAWIVRPAPKRFWYNVLLAPIGSARSACITTIAFILGLIIAIAVTSGTTQATDLMWVPGILGIFWLLLNAIECVASEASNNREKQYRWICVGLGLFLVLGSCYILYKVYALIQSGALT